MNTLKLTASERAITYTLMAAGLSVAAIGVLTLFGWVLKQPLLTAWTAGSLPMAPTTAVLSIGFGVSLCLSAWMPQNRAALFLITLLGVMGSMTALLLLALRLTGVYLSAELLYLQITDTLYLSDPRGVAIFAKAFLGVHAQKSGKNHATANACGCPSRPRSPRFNPTRG